jgi:hypothetical protein
MILPFRASLGGGVKPGEGLHGKRQQHHIPKSDGLVDCPGAGFRPGVPGKIPEGFGVPGAEENLISRPGEQGSAGSPDMTLSLTTIWSLPIPTAGMKA